ncbi:MAG: HAD-IC family P-type ATPase, partial [Defluviitaleaceae bacterium]|nr:HAD-IC family P-type ATPase [Defluviitaleaceae bacterium]
MGLTSKEAARRLEKNGANRLAAAKKKSLIMRILEQFKDFLVLILLAAAAISVYAGDGLKDAILIFGILLVNVIISITQENRADNALAELKNMSAPKAKVKRDGQIEKIDAENVVVGDIIFLDAGDYVPADLKIIESMNLKIDEAMLTGESLPVNKNENCDAFMGTVVTYGRGVGEVTATAMNTEMGKIAKILNEQPESVTPLQIKLNAMAKTLGIICIVTCAAIFFVGLLRGTDVMEMFMVSVSLAVAAVPEGVAIVATVILAIGVQKMVRSNVIVKRLRAVETLGSTTVICSDKTGTLTQNKMTVTKITQNAELICKIAVLCNDAIFDAKTEKKIGDPTETAMLVFAASNGINLDELREKNKRVQEIPFDSERKLMSTLNEQSGSAAFVSDSTPEIAEQFPMAEQNNSAVFDKKIFMHTKGAPDAVLRRSTKFFCEGKILPLTDEIRAQILKQNENFAADALRVLAFAFKECETENSDENDLIFAGMMGMIDPPREEAAAAVEQCRTAGITVKMITGDHKITAAAIAKSLGIIRGDGEVLCGDEINLLSDDELREKTRTVNVFARVSPEHKVKIVTAIKDNGNIAAMTGDGVNDAPSLKKADIGIAMGITGTDVSKEAADMILTDDNFAGIVKAVERGRTIYSNIRKVTGYLLSCNIAEILIIFFAIMCGLPVPLVATQLLFVNLLTDALPAFALGMESKERGAMQRPPRDPQEPIINKTMRSSVIFRAVL